MLRDRSRQFDRALLIASFGRLASPSSTNARRMQDALQALSESLVDEAKPELRFVLELPPAVGIWRDSLDAFRMWADGLSKELELQLEHELARMATRSWALWLRNFNRWWSRGDSVFSFDFEDYLLRVRGAGPPSLLGEDLAAMSMNQWTRLAARPDENVPEWLRGSAWHALGFDGDAAAGS